MEKCKQGSKTIMLVDNKEKQILLLIVEALTLLLFVGGIRVEARAHDTNMVIFNTRKLLS